MDDKKVNTDIEDQITAIENRVKAARKDYESDQLKQFGDPATSNSEDKNGKRAASEFLGSVFASIILGMLIDYFASTAPWGFFLFTLIGFVAGVMRANARMKKSE